MNPATLQSPAPSRGGGGPFLVIAAASDTDALWTTLELRQAFSDREVVIVTPEELAFSRRIVHRVGNAGSHWQIDLGSRRLDSRELSGVLNRMTYLPTAHLGVLGADVSYATQELHALMLSLLASVDTPVFNPPCPVALAGSGKVASEWATLARNMGFAVHPVHFPPKKESVPEACVLVVGRHVIGPSETVSVADRCVKLACAGLTPLLEVRLAHEKEDWVFAGVSSLPSVRPFGGAAIQAIVDTVKDREEMVAAR